MKTNNPKLKEQNDLSEISPAYFENIKGNNVGFTGFTLTSAAFKKLMSFGSMRLWLAVNKKIDINHPVFDEGIIYCEVQKQTETVIEWRDRDAMNKYIDGYAALQQK